MRISTGTVARINWFRLVIFVAIIIPNSVNNTLDKNVPNSTSGNDLQFADTANTAATNKAIRVMESTFEHTYSETLSGETAKNEVTL